MILRRLNTYSLFDAGIVDTDFVHAGVQRVDRVRNSAPGVTDL